MKENYLTEEIPEKGLEEFAKQNSAIRFVEAQFILRGFTLAPAPIFYFRPTFRPESAYIHIKSRKRFNVLTQLASSTFDFTQIKKTSPYDCLVVVDFKDMEPVYYLFIKKDYRKLNGLYKKLGQQGISEKEMREKLYSWGRDRWELLKVKLTGGNISPIITALRKGQFEKVKEMIMNGANINARTRRGTTVLMLAAAFGQKEIVKMLLDRGADHNEEDDMGHNVLCYAKTIARNRKVIKLLKKAGAKTKRKWLLCC